MTSSADLVDLLRAAAEQHPDRILVEDADTVLTYRDAAALATRWAGALADRGCDRGSRVLVHARPSAAFLLAVRAVVEIGAAVVPVDSSYPAARKALLLRASGADIVLELEPDAPLTELDPRIAVVDRAALDGGSPWQRHGRGPAQRLAWICGTSGSTGLPKAVALTDVGLVGLVEGIIERAALTATDRVLPMASIGFSVAAEEILSAWCAGATIVFADERVRQDPVAVAAMLSEQRISVVQMVPAYWYEVVSACTGKRGLRLPDALRLLILGSDIVAPSPVRKWLAAGGLVGHEYGVSEGAVSQVFAVLDAARFAAVEGETAGAIPIGTPLRHATVALLDPAGLPVADGEVGEMHVGGPGVALGYFGDPAATAAAFLPDPDAAVPGSRRYRTGDLARRTSDGMLVFLGRADHQLNVHGIRIEPGEVEAAILGSVEVDAAAVGVRAAVAAATGPTRQLAALIRWTDEVSRQPEEGKAAATRRLRETLAAALPATHVPALLIDVDAVPRNPHGKVDRGAVATLLAAPLRFAGRPPRSALERRVHDVWCESVGAGEIGVDRPLQEIGVDSLGQMRLIAALDRAALRVERAALSSTSTIADVAQHLGTREAAAPVGASAMQGPLSRAQSALYLALRRQGRFPAAGEAYAIPLPGADEARVRDAVDDVLRAHPALRTRLEREAGGVRQRHVDAIPRLGDVRNFADAPALHAALREAVKEGFAPDDDNLARCGLWRTVDTGLLHVVLVAHHLVVDGGSIRILAEDLADAYAARVDGRIWQAEPAASPAGLAAREASHPLPFSASASPPAPAGEEILADIEDVVDTLPFWLTVRPDSRPVARVTGRVGASERARRRRIAKEHGVSESSLSLALLGDALVAETRQGRRAPAGFLVSELVDGRDPAGGSWRTIGYLVDQRLIWLSPGECALSATSMRQVHERRAAGWTATALGLQTGRSHAAADAVTFGWGNLPSTVDVTELAPLHTVPLDVALCAVHVEMDPVGDELAISLTVATHEAEHIDAEALLGRLTSPLADGEQKRGECGAETITAG